MPRDVSSSSSEDEADNPTTESTVKQADRRSRYQCPSDFVSFCHKPCSSTLTHSLKNNNNELWLIKAPASFNPECFSGVKVPLSGLQNLKVPRDKSGSGQQQIYSILGSSHGVSDLSLLTSDKRTSEGMCLGPTFSGLLNMCESYGDLSANQAPQVIPAAPAPSIPSGLKQRFHPFGSKTPTLTYVAENEADGAAFGPSSATLRPLVFKRFLDETSEEGMRKKKRKKDKHREVESSGVDGVTVKQEPLTEERGREATMEIQSQEEAGDMLEKRKKKKKKKDREREEVEQGVEPGESVKEEVTVKEEPMDSLYGDDAVEGSGKKKKKKKKSKTDDD